MRRAITWGIVGTGLILALSSLLISPRSEPPLAAAIPSLPAPVARIPFEAALHDARVWHLRAKLMTKRGLDARDAAGAPTGRADDEAWRRGLLIADPDRAIHHAVSAARRASALARLPSEASRAATLRVVLECDAGHHREELRQAKKLARIEGRSRRSLSVLLRAASCNEEEALVRAVEAALAEF